MRYSCGVSLPAFAVISALSAVHAVAECLPVSLRGDVEVVLVARGVCCPHRRGQHQGEEEEAEPEPLNDVCCFHLT